MTSVATSQSQGGTKPVLPLTERILAWLPGPRWLWVLLWGLSPLIRPFELLGILRLTGQPVAPGFVQAQLPFDLLSVYVECVSLWAASKLVREVKRIQPTLDRLTAEAEGSHLQVFRRLGSTWGPLLLTSAMVVVVVAGGIEYATRVGPAAAALTIPFYVLMTLPMMTAFWVYLALLAGLNRLGSLRLALDPFPEDRSLGLRPVGGLAFTAFWILVAALVPLVVFSIHNPFDLAINLVLFLSGVLIFFLSLLRLHAQMLSAKRQYLQQAREL